MRPLFPKITSNSLVFFINKELYRNSITNCLIKFSNKLKMNASKRLALLALNVSKNQNRSVYRRSYSDPFFGLASSLMRSLDREFNQMRSSMLPSLLGGTSFLPSPKMFDLAPARMQQEDAIITDEQGNRKFHLEFDLRGFEPDEVKVKTEHKMLTVSAKKEKKVIFL